MRTKIQNYESELSETLELANKVVTFYEDVLVTYASKIERLEAENLELNGLLSGAKSLLKATLQTPIRSLIN